MSAHDFSFTSIDGEPIDMSDYTGSAVLVVNTASECGLTPQYAGLETLWQKYRDEGLVVLGVPCNDFGGQEPGSEAEIKAFCQDNYEVDFPLTSKNAVVGDAAHPLYKWAQEQAGDDAVPKWNFHKLLIDPKGGLAACFASAVTPDDDALIDAVEKELGL